MLRDCFLPPFLGIVLSPWNRPCLYPLFIIFLSTPSCHVGRKSMF
ncbi:hypothetical protein CsSME_00034719 [Camellia sinensis var. sinensis]